jgi:hypothetical protein
LIHPLPQSVQFAAAATVFPASGGFMAAMRAFLRLLEFGEERVTPILGPKPRLVVAPARGILAGNDAVRT